MKKQQQQAQQRPRAGEEAGEGEGALLSQVRAYWCVRQPLLLLLCMCLYPGRLQTRATCPHGTRCLHASRLASQA